MTVAVFSGFVHWISSFFWSKFEEVDGGFVAFLCGVRSNEPHTFDGFEYF